MKYYFATTMVILSSIVCSATYAQSCDPKNTLGKWFVDIGTEYKQYCKFSVYRNDLICMDRPFSMKEESSICITKESGFAEIEILDVKNGIAVGKRKSSGKQAGRYTSPAKSSTIYADRLSKETEIDKFEELKKYCESTFFWEIEQLVSIDSKYVKTTVVESNDPDQIGTESNAECFMNSGRNQLILKYSEDGNKSTRAYLKR
jgi:hypothetical protein